MTPGLLIAGQGEAYRLAVAFEHIARRIEKRLPIRKHDVKELLTVESRKIRREVDRATGERSALQAVVGFQSAREAATQCHTQLDRLSMINLGGKADLTAGLEILERIDEVVGDVLGILCGALPSPPQTDGESNPAQAEDNDDAVGV